MRAHNLLVKIQKSLVEGMALNLYTQVSTQCPMS